MEIRIILFGDFGRLFCCMCLAVHTMLRNILIWLVIAYVNKFDIIRIIAN